jgi:hypothetical protein
MVRRDPETPHPAKQSGITRTIPAKQLSKLWRYFPTYARV